MSNSTSDCPTLDIVHAYVAAQRPRHISKIEKLSILQLHGFFRDQGEKAVSHKVATITARSVAVVKAVWAEFKSTGELVDGIPAANTTQHATRVPHTPVVEDLVRRFVRDRSATRTRTVAKDVVALLVKAKHIAIHVNKPADYHACIRAVRRFIQKQGYARGRRKEVSIRKAKLYGLDIFVGGKKVKDYHAMFNHSYFVQWFNKLMDEVEADGHRGIVFVMDNAKYHKGAPDDTPKGTWSKELLYLACLEYGIDVSPFDLRETMWLLLHAHVVAAVEPLVVQAAAARGHLVVYTPPYYSELQPIETVWAQVKGRVGMQYDEATSFAMVHQRLTQAFAELTSNNIDGHIRHSTSFLVDLAATLQSADDGDDSALMQDSASDDDASGACETDDDTDE
ncbi:hypothetical protein ACHHYP_14385 [Achlya hypogyna]|uniref:Uncharacterized protein n=1 Tax=Achlya hypogyna TaxID=1202772 RepID=A0A1V9YDE8_ACHHY|nr:hypothetical protein ACHHYP_14385 [Achlya hypogyna]